MAKAPARCDFPTVMPSDKIDVKSNISYEGGSLSGHWSKRTFGLEGDLSGRAAPNRFTVQILGHGPGFSTVSISFSRG